MAEVKLASTKSSTVANVETKIVVRTAGGSRCEICPCDSWTCHDLKAEIQRRLDISVPQQRLIHGTRLLEEVMDAGSMATVGQLLRSSAGQDTSMELLLYVRSDVVAEMLEAVQWDGRALARASEDLKDDREVVMEAVKQTGKALAHASEELRGDRAVVMEAVKRHGYVIQHASEELKGDREVVMEAVRKHGKALEHASQELRYTTLH